MNIKSNLLNKGEANPVFSDKSNFNLNLIFYLYLKTIKYKININNLK